jgi:hypothetical protein
VPERATLPREPEATGGDRRAPAPVHRARAPAGLLTPQGLLLVQRSAGNRAVQLVLARQDRPPGAPAPPAPPPPPGPAPPAGSAAPPEGGAQQPAAPPQPILESPHGEVNRRPVVEVGGELRGKLERVAHVIPRMRRGSEDTQRDEREWFANRGIVGWGIDLINDVDEVDPARWDAVLTRWDGARGAVRTALDLPPNAEHINDLGQRGQVALTSFEEAAEQDRQRREEYSRYLAGFSHSAQGVYTTSVIVRDVSFAAAVGLAVVVAAPVVAGGLATVGTGTLGMTAGSTSLAAFTYGGTAVAMGGLGAGIEGTGQALGTLGAQASMALSDLIRGSSTAADNFDLGQVAAGGWEGMQRGFVDGVLAFAGAQAERVVASHASAAVRAMLGPGNSSLYAVVIRRTLTRAISGGVTGGPIGALQAGYRAAAEGQDLNGIAASMRHGFEIGAGLGAALGAAGGAWEARGADQLRQRVAAQLRERAAAAGRPGTVDQDVLVNGILEQMRANPTAGNNQRLLELTPRVWRALNDPDTVAAALSEVWLEEHLLGLMAPRVASERYGQAAAVLSRRRGAPVIVLPAGQQFGPQDFFEQVVVRGNRFLDQSVLAASPEHGATTHMIQDLAVDRMLFGTGVRAEQYRALLSGAVGRDGSRVGNDLWIELYDSFAGGINQPEVVHPIMRSAIPVP